MARIKLTLALYFAICLHATLFGQALDLTVPNVSGPNGNTVTVEIVFNNFTDILAVEGNLTWDPTVATYVSHTVNTNLTPAANAFNVFTVGTPGQGSIPSGKLTWVYNFTDTNDGNDRPNGEVLISVNLQIIGLAGSSSALSLSGPDPTTSFIRFDPNSLIPTTQAPTITNGLLTVSGGAVTGFVQTADICNDTVWTTGSEIILDNYIFVKDGATLTIQPGVVVRGKDNLASNNILPDGTNLGAVSVSNDRVGALIVTRTGKIEANGTAQNPIIFTAVKDNLSNASDLSCSDVGLWGGLLLLGNASVNSPTANFNAAKGFIENTAEGIITTDPATATKSLYGGANDADDQGTLRYVSIRHAGDVIIDGDEINGLTLCGVGRGTEINFVEVIASSDDGIEVFGGTVDIKHAVSTCVVDDAFDYDQGYRGRGQFWVGIEPGNRLGEHDGGANPETATPFSVPQIYNATYVGKAAASGEQETLVFRDNAGGRYSNSLFFQSQQGVEIEYRYDVSSSYFQLANVINDPTLGTIQALTLSNNVFSEVSGNGFFLDVVSLGFVGSLVQVRSTSNATSTIADFANGIIGNNLFQANVLSQSSGAYNLKPTSSFGNESTTPNDGFFETAAYTGAISPSATNNADWLAQWTATAAYGIIQP